MDINSSSAQRPSSHQISLDFLHPLLEIIGVVATGDTGFTQLSGAAQLKTEGLYQTAQNLMIYFEVYEIKMV